MTIPEPTWKAGPNVIGLRVGCPSCGTTQRVERDEDGGSIETWRCTDDCCMVQVCRNCRWICRGCNLPFCEHHIVDFGSEPWCRECLTEGADQAQVDSVAEELAGVGR